MKPVRLEVKDLNRKLEVGDYLRVHHNPRRYPAIHDRNWEGKYDPRQLVGENSISNSLPGAIVGQDVEKGYIVINKPAGLPVHATVDNILENVAAVVGRSILKNDGVMLEEKVIEMAERQSTTQLHKKKKETLIYVVTPQRLDQDTSGLLVIGTKKIFAAYFANLLRKKTDIQLRKTELMNVSLTGSAINKTYRCLVCVIPKASTGHVLESISMWDEIEQLRSHVENQSVVRHYLEQSKKTPRIFAPTPDQEGMVTWLECLMKLSKIGKVYPVIGSKESSELSRALWGKEGAFHVFGNGGALFSVIPKILSTLIAKGDQMGALVSSR